MGSETPPTKAMLHTLIPELQLEISSHLTQGDRYHLIQTCRTLHQNLASELYYHDARYDDNYALWWACMHNRPATARLALSCNPGIAGARFEHPSGSGAKGGTSALSVAASQANYELVELLISYGADPPVPDGALSMDGTVMFPIDWAFEVHTWHNTKKIKTIKTLLRHGADLNNPTGRPTDPANGPRRELPIFRAVDAKMPTEWLSRYRTCKAPSNHHKFLETYLRRQLRVLESTLRSGADANALDATGRTPLLRLLDEFRAYRPVFLYDRAFATRGEEDEQRAQFETYLLAQIELLLAHGADVRAQADVLHMQDYGTVETGVTALHLACRLDEYHAGVAKFLAQRGCDVSAVDGRGRTPLFWLCETLPRDTGLLRFLLLKGNIDVNHCRKDGRTLLHVVCASLGIGVTKVLPIARILVEHGADVDLSDDCGNTADAYAVVSNDFATARYLRSVSRKRAETIRRRRNSIMMLESGASPRDDSSAPGTGRGFRVTHENACTYDDAETSSTYTHPTTDTSNPSSTNTTPSTSTTTTAVTTPRHQTDTHSSRGKGRGRGKGGWGHGRGDRGRGRGFPNHHDNSRPPYRWPSLGDEGKENKPGEQEQETQEAKNRQRETPPERLLANLSISHDESRHARAGGVEEEDLIDLGY